MSRDYIPTNHAQFREFLRKIMDYTDSRINVDPPIWKNIPAERWDVLAARFKAFTDASDKALMTPTPQNIHNRGERQTEATAELRGFVNQFLRFPPVNDGDRIAMGIPVHDTIRTPQPTPDTVPEIEADTSTIRVLHFRMRNKGSETWGKPEHVHGMELAWGIMDARPSQVSELPHMETATANPITIKFEEEDRGKRVFYAARWVNNTSQHGPWSDIESSFVP